MLRAPKAFKPYVYNSLEHCESSKEVPNLTYIRSVWRTKDNGLRSARLEKVENHLGIDLMLFPCLLSVSSHRL